MEAVSARERSLGERVEESRAFARRGAFAYLEPGDRYLGGAAGEPRRRYGYIGCGMMGQEHIRNTLLLGRATVGGVYDPAEKSVRHALEAVAHADPAASPRVYPSLEAACADPETDALIVATPNHTHLEVLRVAARHDKAILLEKPIATTVADAFEVCRLAGAHPQPVRFGLQYRYKAVYAECIDEVFGRESVGRVHSVSMLEHRVPFLDKVGQWNKFNDRTGGTLIEKCCHYFDLMGLFAGGRPVSVFAVGSQAVNFRSFTYNNRRADGLDQAQVTVTYDNGVIGAFSLSMFVPGIREELTLCGEAGRLHAVEDAPLGRESENRVEVWRGDNGASRVTTPTYPPYIARAGHHGATFFEHAAFADDLASGERSGASLADAFWSVVVGAAAQTSVARGEVVEVAELLPEGYDPAVLGERVAAVTAGRS